MVLRYKAFFVKIFIRGGNKDLFRGYTIGNYKRALKFSTNQE